MTKKDEATTQTVEENLTEEVKNAKKVGSKKSSSKADGASKTEEKRSKPSILAETVPYMKKAGLILIGVVIGIGYKMITEGDVAMAEVCEGATNDDI